MMIYFSSSTPRAWEDIPPGSELLLHLFPDFRISSVGQNTLPRIQQGWLGRQQEQIYSWWFGQLASDNVRKCTSLLFPGATLVENQSKQVLTRPVLKTAFLLANSGQYWSTENNEISSSKNILYSSLFDAYKTGRIVLKYTYFSYNLHNSIYDRDWIYRI